MSNVVLKIKGMRSSLHQKLLQELAKEGFVTDTVPSDRSILVQCPVTQSDVPGEIVHRLLEESENERRAEAA